MKILGIIIFVLLLTTVLIVLFSSEKVEDEDDDDSCDEEIFTAKLTGLAETPPNASTAKGDAILSFNPILNTFTLLITYSGLIPTAAHIHKGHAGVAGPVIFPLDHTVNPMVYTSPRLTFEEIADLKNSLYYVNIHTAQYPGGEIRGQITY